MMQSIYYERALAYRSRQCMIRTIILEQCFLERGQLDEAVKSYKIALALKPDFLEANNNIGTCIQ